MYLQTPRSAKIVRFVHDDDYTLCLNIGALIELQEVRDIGPPVILARLQNAAWHVQDIKDTIRCALIGGGMKPVDAKRLVDRAIIEGYLHEYLATAIECLFASLVGIPDIPEEEEASDEPGEDQAPTMNED